MIEGLSTRFCDNSVRAHRTSAALDWALGVTLLAVGILSVYGTVFQLSVPMTYALIGAGSAYLGIMLMQKSLRCDYHFSAGT